MAITTITTQEGNRVHITAHDAGLFMAIFSENISLTFTFTESDARALAERIINSLDNFKLTTIKEQDHAELRN